jgi:hypothetical protein
MRKNDSLVSRSPDIQLGKMSLFLAAGVVLLVIACVVGLRWPGLGLALVLEQSISLLWMMALLVNSLGIVIGIAGLVRSKQPDRLGLTGVIANIVVGTAVFSVPILFYWGLFAYALTHPVR